MKTYKLYFGAQLLALCGGKLKASVRRAISAASKVQSKLASLNSMLHFLFEEKLTTFQCMSQFTNWNYATTNYANTFCKQQLGIKTMGMRTRMTTFSGIYETTSKISKLLVDFFLFLKTKRISDHQ